MSVPDRPLSFNRQVALDRVGGDEELFREVAQLFLTEYPALLEAVTVAVDTADPAGLLRSAHTLKGSLGSLGADRAADTALRLEAMGRLGQMHGSRQACEELRQLLAELHKELRDL